MKNLFTTLLVLMAFNFASAADFTIQVQSTAKNWKVKNGTTVVATLERDPTGNTGSASNVPYFSTLIPGLKINGSVSNTPQRVLTVRKLDPSFMGVMTQATILYSGPNCTGVPYSSYPFGYLDGVNNIDSKYMYVKDDETLVIGLNYQSRRDASLNFNCEDNASGTSDAYPLSECTVATCGFNSGATLKIYHE